MLNEKSVNFGYNRCDRRLLEEKVRATNNISKKPSFSECTRCKCNYGI